MNGFQILLRRLFARFREVRLLSLRRTPTVCALLLSLECSNVLDAAVVPPPNAKEHWAFHPPRAVEPPIVKNRRWARTDVDTFILHKLEEEHLSPAPLAEPRVLLRRMCFDLTGLSPSPEESDAFVADVLKNREAAIQRTIEKLLASPRYGERWGRHWLDLARYSDTKGYVYAREERFFVHAPTYRDWVVRAFNEDLPYDQFLRLQLAADQYVPANSPDLAAMGFLTGGRRFIGVTHDIIDDRIDVVMRGTQALTLACARCHDHKYDPIPTKDYYSLYGVFHACDEELVTWQAPKDEELQKRMQKLADTMKLRREEAGARLRNRVGDYLRAQLELQNYPEQGFDQLLGPEDLIPTSVRRWRDFLETVDPQDGNTLFAPWRRVASLPLESFSQACSNRLSELFAVSSCNPLLKKVLRGPFANPSEVAKAYGQLFQQAQADPQQPGAAECVAFLHRSDSPTVVPDTAIVNNELFFPTSATEELWKLQGDVDRRRIELKAPAALVLKDRGREPNPRVFQRGSPSKLGEEVPRRFLEVLSSSQRVAFTNGSGRMELAECIANPSNPLTARVMVNRIWQHHFGVGLVKTSSDFGLRAETPSHPELLDWLARQFIASGWSVKAMHRLILSSSVYQWSSKPVLPEAGRSGVKSDALARDPENRWLSYFPMHRLEFEQWRDAMLQLSGELDETRGGAPQELLDKGNRRRTLYSLVDRQFFPGVLRSFDFANPDLHVPSRHETTVPQQALFFLNGDFVGARAKALAARFARSSSEEKVRGFYRLLFQRAPNRHEVSAALKFVAEAERDVPPPPPEPKRTPWQYGFGAMDEAHQQVVNFRAFPHFTGHAWQGAEAWPGGVSGWGQLTAEGGHPGNTRSEACIRRWIAPAAGSVRIEGVLKHEPEPGDGVQAFVVSSRQGVLKSERVHQGLVSMECQEIHVNAGEILDFVVDIGDVLNSDQFLWSPRVIQGATVWNAKADFDGPHPAPVLLSPWEQYAQVLLLSNEFAFVD